MRFRPRLPRRRHRGRREPPSRDIRAARRVAERIATVWGQTTRRG